MNKIALLSTLSFALLTSFGAQAADTAELKVKGVIRPSACTPSFVGGGVADYGTIPAKSLTAGVYKQLADKEIPFAINCDGPAKMALKVTDNRVASAMQEATGFPATMTFGLGAVSGTKIGGYVLRFKQSDVTTDGVAATQIYSTDNNSTWTSTGANGTLGTDRSFSWATAGTATPAAYKTVSGKITVSTYLNKPENLPMSQDIPLDGSATLEVQYL